MYQWIISVRNSKRSCHLFNCLYVKWIVKWISLTPFNTTLYSSDLQIRQSLILSSEFTDSNWQSMKYSLNVCLIAGWSVSVSTQRIYIIIPLKIQQEMSEKGIMKSSSTDILKHFAVSLLSFLYYFPGPSQHSSDRFPPSPMCAKNCQENHLPPKCLRACLATKWQSEPRLPQGEKMLLLQMFPCILLY